MEHGKLTHAVIGSVLSWSATAWSLFEQHAGLVAGLFAITASCYTIKAARETIKLRRAQRRLVEDDL